MAASAFPPTIFVLGTSEHSGKTVAAVGLMCKLLSSQYRLALDEIGYMKPVGQYTVLTDGPDGAAVEAERDAALVTSLMGMPSPRFDLIGPLVWTGGRTVRCIDEECCREPSEIREEHLQVVRRAYRRLARGKRAMVVEGTGQLGVGSVGGASGADVVGSLVAMGVPVYVVLVVGGGADAAIAESALHVLALDHLGVRLHGLIANRVEPDALASTSRLLCAYYQRIFPRIYVDRDRPGATVDVLGCVPEVPDLALPTVRLVRDLLARSLGTELDVVAWPERPEPEGVLARRFVVLSLERDYHRLLRDGDAVVVGINANSRILSLVDFHREALRAGRLGLAGVILSCRSVGGLLPGALETLRRSGLHVLAVDLDSAEVVQMARAEPVKLQPYDAAKRALIAEVYCRHIDRLPGFGAPRAPGPGARREPAASPRCLRAG